MTIVSLKNSLCYFVLASEREATQMMMQNRALRIRGTLENSVSWIASLFARKDELLARLRDVYF